MFTVAILNEVFFLFASSWFSWREQVPGVLINHQPRFTANPQHSAPNPYSNMFLPN